MNFTIAFFVKFDIIYKITYKLEIFDYVGEAKIILTDYLPYEIDEEKSSIGDICKYVDGKIICEYSQNIIDEATSKINIEEKTKRH